MEDDMTTEEKAVLFATLHIKGAPLILYNAWDAGSAKVIANAGAKAVATSSWAVAESQGYADGEEIPKALAEQIVGRIVASVDVPVSLDFEGGYTEDDGELGENVKRLLDLGVIGINFEDRVVHGEGLYPIHRQAARIAAIRETANEAGIPLFINARTDLFLARGEGPSEMYKAALRRGHAYADAGASGFFVPGVKEDALIERLCDAIAVPVNVMILNGVPSVDRLTKMGVSRISYGSIPHDNAMAVLRKEASKLYTPP
jgi:2-methylisocitrate lyase-like PEP mutase family enzyme